MKKTVMLVGGGVILLLALILVGFPRLGLQSIGLAVSIGILATFLALSIRASTRQHRAVLREIGRVDNRVSRVEYRTEPIHDIRGSVVKTSAETHEALIHLREIADQGFPTASPADGVPAPSSAPRVERSIFAPETIRTAGVQGRPNLHSAGRDAARQESDGSSVRNLSRLLYATDAERKRDIAVIGAGSMAERLQGLGTVTRLTPGSALTGLPASPSYAVVDVTTLASSPWRGVLDASATQLFTELRSLLIDARKRGAVVVVHGRATPSHFSSSLEALAHVLVHDGVASTRWGDDIESDLLHVMTSSTASSTDDANGTT